VKKETVRESLLPLNATACWRDEAHEPTHCQEAERYPKLRACIDKVSREAMGFSKEAGNVVRWN
jgi:hypothetical protein